MPPKEDPSPFRSSHKPGKWSLEQLMANSSMPNKPPFSASLKNTQSNKDSSTSSGSKAETSNNKNITSGTTQEKKKQVSVGYKGEEEGVEQPFASPSRSLSLSTSNPFTTREKDNDKIPDEGEGETPAPPPKKFSLLGQKAIDKVKHAVKSAKFVTRTKARVTGEVQNLEEVIHLDHLKKLMLFFFTTADGKPLTSTEDSNRNFKSKKAMERRQSGATFEVSPEARRDRRASTTLTALRRRGSLLSEEGSNRPEEDPSGLSPSTDFVGLLGGEAITKDNLEQSTRELGFNQPGIVQRRIHEAEFVASVRSVLKDQTSSDIRRWYRRIDADDDGVNWDEFSQFILNHSQQRKALDQRLSEFATKAEPESCPTVRQHSDFVTRIVTHPRSGHVYTCSRDGSIREWHHETLELINELYTGNHWITGMCFMKGSGYRLLTCSVDRAVSIFDVKSGEMLKTFKGSEVKETEEGLKYALETLQTIQVGYNVPSHAAPKNVRTRALHRGGAVNDESCKVQTFDQFKEMLMSERSRQAQKKKLEQATLVSLTEVPLAIAHPTHDMNAFKKKDPADIAREKVDPTDNLFTFGNSPAGSEDVVYLGLRDGTIMCYHLPLLSTPLVKPQCKWEHIHEKKINDMQIIPYLNALLSSSDDMTAKLSDLFTGRILRSFDHNLAANFTLKQPKLHTHGVHHMAWSEAFKIVVTCSPGERVVYVWNHLQDQPIYKIEEHMAPMLGVEINDQNGQMITMSVDGTCKVWEIRTFVCIQSFSEKRTDPEDQDFSVIHFDSARQRIICGSTFPQQYPLRKKASTFPPNYLGHTVPVYGALFSQDYEQIVTTDSDIIIVWSAATGECNFTFNLQSFIALVDDCKMTAFSLDANQKRMLTGFHHGIIVVWNFCNGQPLNVIRSAESASGAISSSPGEVHAVAALERMNQTFFLASVGTDLWIALESDQFSITQHSRWAVPLEYGHVTAIAQCSPHVAICGTSSGALFFFHIMNEQQDGKPLWISEYDEAAGVADGLLSPTTAALVHATGSFNPSISHLRPASFMMMGNSSVVGGISSPPLSPGCGGVGNTLMVPQTPARGEHQSDERSVRIESPGKVVQDEELHRSDARRGHSPIRKSIFQKSGSRAPSPNPSGPKSPFKAGGSPQRSPLGRSKATQSPARSKRRPVSRGKSERKGRENTTSAGLGVDPSIHYSEKRSSKVESLVILHSPANVVMATHSDGRIAFWNHFQRCHLWSYSLTQTTQTMVSNIVIDPTRNDYIAYNDELGNIFVWNLDISVTSVSQTRAKQSAMKSNLLLTPTRVDEVDTAVQAGMATKVGIGENQVLFDFTKTRQLYSFHAHEKTITSLSFARMVTPCIVTTSQDCSTRLYTLQGSCVGHYGVNKWSLSNSATWSNPEPREAIIHTVESADGAEEELLLMSGGGEASPQFPLGGSGAPSAIAARPFTAPDQNAALQLSTIGGNFFGTEAHAPSRMASTLTKSHHQQQIKSPTSFSSHPKSDGISLPPALQQVDALKPSTAPNRFQVSAGESGDFPQFPQTARKPPPPAIPKLPTELLQGSYVPTTSPRGIGSSSTTTTSGGTNHAQTSRPSTGVSGDPSLVTASIPRPAIARWDRRIHRAKNLEGLIREDFKKDADEDLNSWANESMSMMLPPNFSGGRASTRGAGRSTSLRNVPPPVSSSARGGPTPPPLSSRHQGKSSSSLFPGPGLPQLNSSANKATPSVVEKSDETTTSSGSPRARLNKSGSVASSVGFVHPPRTGESISRKASRGSVSSSQASVASPFGCTVAPGQTAGKEFATSQSISSSQNNHNNVASPSGASPKPLETSIFRDPPPIPVTTGRRSTISPSSVAKRADDKLPPPQREVTKSFEEDGIGNDTPPLPTQSIPPLLPPGQSDVSSTASTKAGESRSPSSHRSLSPPTAILNRVGSKKSIRSNNSGKQSTARSSSTSSQKDEKGLDEEAEDLNEFSGVMSHLQSTSSTSGLLPGPPQQEGGVTTSSFAGGGWESIAIPVPELTAEEIEEKKKQAVEDYLDLQAERIHKACKGNSVGIMSQNIQTAVKTRKHHLAMQRRKLKKDGAEEGAKQRKSRFMSVVSEESLALSQRSGETSASGGSDDEGTGGSQKKRKGKAEQMLKDRDAVIARKGIQVPLEWTDRVFSMAETVKTEEGRFFFDKRDGPLAYGMQSETLTFKTSEQKHSHVSQFQRKNKITIFDRTLPRAPETKSTLSTEGILKLMDKQGRAKSKASGTY